MFVVRNILKRSSGKIYHSILLRKSYRENGKVKKKTIANLSNCSESEISLIETCLKKKTKEIIDNDFRLLQGKSFGAVYILHQFAKRLGIVQALGSSFHANLALWLIIARILEQGSRLSAARLDKHYDIASIIGLERGFDENNLYDCLRWLSENQKKIENNLFHQKQHSTKFYWYDVTSSYLEGEHNELAAFGYNRDKKKRKRIIVVGLLCEQNGNPISIEAFKGNTQDTQTIESQILKLKHRFECQSIAVVGDRGLIRNKQKILLEKHGLHYISALTLPEVLSLINNGHVNLHDFTQDLRSFSQDGVRYIYRCNAERALETQRQRQERFETAQRKVDQENQRLREKHKVSAMIAKKRIKKVLKKLCVYEWVSVNVVKRQLVLKIEEGKLKEKEKMDGCYIWTTDLSEKETSDREVYERYKDLKYVEDDFRTLKTTFLEIRPIYVRTEESTRGHILVSMLAHMIVRELRSAWVKFDKTVHEALSELSFLCRNYILFPNGKKVSCIPEANESMAALLHAAQITLPNHHEEIIVPVVTRRKVRKSANI